MWAISIHHTIIYICNCSWTVLHYQKVHFFFKSTAQQIFWLRACTCLPFRPRSAPYLFNRFSDALHWILQHNYGVEHLLHYLDDFFTAGSANSDTCDQNLHAMLTLCKTFNAPIKPSKVEGPTTLLTFLGIHLDTISMEANITEERKQSLLQELTMLQGWHKCTKHELLSLIGKLSFSCKILPAGRIFLCRLN